MAYWSSGEVLTAADLNNAISVLQTVQTTYSTQVFNSTSTFAVTGLSASITPESTSSKVLVIVNQTFGKTSSFADNRVQWRIKRDSTVIWTSSAIEFYTATTLLLIGPASMAYLDSPSSTSALTYSTEFMNPNNTSAVASQYGDGVATMTLMEIAG